MGGRVGCLLILLHRWLRFVLLSSVGLLYLCGLLVVNYLDCLYFCCVCVCDCLLGIICLRDLVADLFLC